MSLGLKTHILNFDIIPTGNPKTLVFADASDYYKSPELPILQIVPPGFTKHFTINIEFGKINILSSATIGLTDILKCEPNADLLDGIYELNYKICPYEFFSLTKHYLKTDITNKKIADIFNSIECNSYIIDISDLRKQLTDILILMESAKACVNEGYIQRGQKDFLLAQKKIDKILEKI